jgi:hypothetical protein
MGQGTLEELIDDVWSASGVIFIFHRNRKVYMIDSEDYTSFDDFEKAVIKKLKGQSAVLVGFTRGAFPIGRVNYIPEPVINESLKSKVKK